MNPYLRNFLFFVGGFISAYVIGILLFFNAIRKDIINQQQQTPTAPQ